MTTKVDVELRVARPDDLYQALVEMHRDLSEEESRLADAKLILLLANQVGDLEVVREAIRLAREGIR